MKDGKGYHKLIVWQVAREFVLLVYQLTEMFPKSEEFGLKGQLRRASVSIALNIVEGYRRTTRKESLQFLSIANGSLSECEAAVEISHCLHYFSTENFEILEKKRG